MVDAPKCKLCGKRHWLNEPHAGMAMPETYVSRETVITEEGIGKRYDWDRRERELGLRK